MGVPVGTWLGFVFVNWPPDLCSEHLVLVLEEVVSSGPLLSEAECGCAVEQAGQMVIVDVFVVVLVILLEPEAPPAVTDLEGDSVPAITSSAKDKIVRSVEERMVLKFKQR